MRLEHIFDLDLRYEGEYVVVRPYGGLDGVGYAAGAGRATGPRVEGDVRFSNNPRYRGDGVVLADLAGAIATDDGARIVFSIMGLGRKNANGRSFDVALAMTLEPDDEHFDISGFTTLTERLATVGRRATVIGRHVKMQVHRLLAEDI